MEITHEPILEPLSSTKHTSKLRVFTNSFLLKLLQKKEDRIVSSLGLRDEIKVSNSIKKNSLKVSLKTLEKILALKIRIAGLNSCDVAETRIYVGRLLDKYGQKLDPLKADERKIDQLLIAREILNNDFDIKVAKRIYAAYKDKVFELKTFKNNSENPLKTLLGALIDSELAYFSRRTDTFRYSAFILENPKEFSSRSFSSLAEILKKDSKLLLNSALDYISDEIIEILRGSYEQLRAVQYLKNTEELSQGGDSYFFGMNVTKHYQNNRPGQITKAKEIENERKIASKKIETVCNFVEEIFKDIPENKYKDLRARFKILKTSAKATSGNLGDINFEIYSEVDSLKENNKEDLAIHATWWGKIASELRKVENSVLCENSLLISLNLKVLAYGEMSSMVAGHYSDMGFFYLGNAGYLEKFIHSKFGQGNPQRDVNLESIDKAIKCFRTARLVREELFRETKEEYHLLEIRNLNLEINTIISRTGYKEKEIALEGFSNPF